MMASCNIQYGSALDFSGSLHAYTLPACQVMSMLIFFETPAEMMQPDEVTLGKMMEDSTIMDGFNDPEVMSAVAEIAQNPEAYPKHAAKVGSTWSCLTINNHLQHNCLVWRHITQG